MDNQKQADLMIKASAALESAITKLAASEKRAEDLQLANDELSAKVAKYERKEKCEGIVETMIAKGIVSPSEYPSEVKKLAESDEDLNAIEKAASLINAGSMGISYVGDDEPVQGKTADEIAIEKFNRIQSR